MTRKTSALLAAAALACLSLCSSLRAAPLESPADAPILTVTGNIDATNMKGAAVFDRAMLEGMDKSTVVTHTPWFQDTVTFEGVPLDKVMEAVGAKGKTITVHALNDYVTDIPLDDVATHRAVLAYKRDGKYMAVRDKGPLFIVYPYDSDPALQNQVYYKRSAWQVSKIVVD